MTLFVGKGGFSSASEGTSEGETIATGLWRGHPHLSIS